MKWIRVLIFLFSALLVTHQLKGQPTGVQALINIPPPYSPYFSNYTSLLDNQIVTLRNYTDQTVEVKLVGSITSNVNINVFTNQSYQPLSPIVLGPNQSVILMGADQNLQYLDPDNASFEGDQEAIDNLLINGILPDGDYTICIRVVDYYTDEIYSADDYSCVLIPIKYLSPPDLINPLCDEILTTDPAMLSFSWSPPVGNTFGAQIVYDLYIVDVQEGANPVDAILAAIEFGAGENVWSQLDLPVNFYIHQPFDLEFEPGKLYAWAVVARDANEKLFITNNGLSQVCTFFLPDEQEGLIGAIDEDFFDVEPVDEEDPFEATRTTIAGTLLYRFQEHEGKPNIFRSETSIGSLISVTYFQSGGSMSNSIGLAPAISGDNREFVFAGTLPMTGQDMALGNQRIFLEQVYMSSYVPNPTRPEHYYVIDDIVGKDIMALDYDKDVADEDKLAHFFEGMIFSAEIAGQTLCQYLHYPSVSTVLSATTTTSSGQFLTSFQQLLPMGKIYHGRFNIAPLECEGEEIVDNSGYWKDIIFGKYLGGWRINPWEQTLNPGNTMTNPADNTMSTMALFNNPSFIGANHNQIIAGTFGGGGYQTMSGTLDIDPFDDGPGKSMVVNKALTNIMGDGNTGTARFTFGSGNAYNYQVEKANTGSLNLINQGIASKINIGFNKSKDYPKVPVEGYHLYRAIRIRVENPQYCSPDIILLPVQGSEINLEPEVVLVNSYNLEVIVKGEDSPGPLGNMPIPNVRVNTGRLMQDDLALQHIMPNDELRRNVIGIVENTLDNSMQYVRMDFRDTDGSGKVAMKRLVKHRYQSDYYYMEAGLLFTENFSYQPIAGKVVPMAYNDVTYETHDRTPFINRHIFNHQFEAHQFTYETTLQAQRPEIYGQFVTSAGGVDAPVDGVDVYLWSVDKWVYYHQKTGPDGIFHFRDLDPGTYRFPDMAVQKPGYKTYKILQDPGYMGLGERRTYVPVLLEPRGFVRGFVEDEHGAPVMAEMKIGAGPYFVTQQTSGLALQDTGSGSNTTSPQGQGSTPASSQLLMSGVQAALVTFNQGAPSSNQTPSSTTTGIRTDLTNIQTSTIGQTAGQLQIQETAYLPGLSIFGSWRSSFSVPAESGMNVPVIIHPLSDKYFPDTILVTIPSGNTQSNPHNLGVLEVKEKLHRPKISVYTLTQIPGTSMTSKQPVPGAEVIIGNQPAMNTSNTGFAEFSFGSPANEFRIRIRKEGVNHIPIDEYITIPISKEPIVYEFELKLGKTISGVVTDASNGEPINNARVFVVTDNHDYGQVITETYTDQSGAYALAGVPEAMMIRMHAVKAAAGGQKGYIGRSYWVNTNTTDTRNFSLTLLPWQLEDIWGFPVEVTQLSYALQPPGSDLSTIQQTAAISGYLTARQGNERFQPEEGQARVRFSDLGVRPAGNGAEPVANAFDIDEQKIRLVLNGHFSANAATRFKQKIRVHRIDDTPLGYFSGPVETTLEYFNFSYNYTGTFNLHQDKTVRLPFLYATPGAPMPASYQVGRLFLFGGTGGTGVIRNPKFHVHEFPAEADHEESYVEGNTFYLKSILTVTLPMMQESIKIPTDYIRVTPTNVNILTQGESLEFNLELWTVKTGPWEYDKNFGGLRVKKATVLTETINVQNLDLTIKPDRLIMNNSADVDWSSLRIGGFAPLTPVSQSGSKISFGFVEVCPHDQKPHWALTILNVNDAFGNVAYMTVPQLTNQRIYYKRVYQFSDGFENTALGDNQVIDYHGHFTQSVSNVSSGNNFFYVNGMVDLKVPGYQMRNGTFIWTREGNQTILKPMAYVPKIELSGRVTFDGNETVAGSVLNAQEFSLLGTITIDDASSDQDIVLHTRFFKRKQEAEVRIIRLGNNEAIGTMQAIGVSSEGHQRVVEGNTIVQNNKWRSVKYLSELTNFENIKEGQRRVWMEVTGDIRRDPNDSNAIEFTNIDMGFGTFSMVFNFATATLIGTLQISTPLPLGAATINQGTVQIAVGPNGFYLLAQVQGTYPVIATLNTNFILGGYHPLPAEAFSLLKQNMYIQKTPETLNHGLAGFYLAANKPLVNIHETIDLLVVAIGLYVNVGIDARFLANFNPQQGTISLMGLAYADLEVYARVLVCDFCAGILAEISIGANLILPGPSFTSGKADFEAFVCATLGLSISICSLVDFNETIKAEFKFNANDPKISPTIEIGGTCSGNVDPPGSSSGCKHF